MWSKAVGNSGDFLRSLERYPIFIPGLFNSRVHNNISSQITTFARGFATQVAAFVWHSQAHPSRASILIPDFQKSWRAQGTEGGVLTTVLGWVLAELF